MSNKKEFKKSRQEKREAALRANLKRRKQQERARQDEQPTTDGDK